MSYSNASPEELSAMTTEELKTEIGELEHQVRIHEHNEKAYRAELKLVWAECGRLNGRIQELYFYAKNDSIRMEDES